MNDYYEILKFIQNDVSPKYKELMYCTMHILPAEFVNKDVEYIIKIQSNLNEIKISHLKNDILRDIISAFGRGSTRKILIRLSRF